MKRIPDSHVVNKASLPTTAEVDAEGEPWESDRDRMVAFTAMFKAAQESPAWGHILDYMKVLGELGYDVREADMFERCVKAATEKWEDANRARPPAPEPDIKPHDSIVYYMKLGNLVKIGISRRIGQRVLAFNPQRVLAVEPGANALEKVRHRQFADLNEQGEWFRYEQPIKDHISQLPARFKQGTGVDMNDWLAEHLKVGSSKRMVPFGLEDEEPEPGTG